MRLDSGRVFGLDMMRASAIALVIFSHTAIWFGAVPAMYYAGLLAGYFGVELFFVLSGFLIGGILFRGLTELESGLTLPSFWGRRWLRTLPNYFLFLVVNILLTRCLSGRSPALFSYFFFCQNLTAPSPPFYSESWSLALEEWFYLLLPLFFFGISKCARRRFAGATLALILGVIALVTVARARYVCATHPGWLLGVRVIVVYRLDACMFGVLAAWMKHFAPEIWAQRTIFRSALGLFGLAFMTWLPFELPADAIALHIFGFTVTSLAAALLLPALDQWKTVPMWGRPAVRLSLWSYSLYLVNMPVFALLFHYFLGAPPYFCGAAFVVLSISLAALVYRVYEAPIMNLRNKSFAILRLPGGLNARLTGPGGDLATS